MTGEASLEAAAARAAATESEAEKSVRDAAARVGAATQRSADALEEMASRTAARFEELRAKVRELRAASAEALLSGSLLLSDVQRESSTWNSASQAKASEERFRRALEAVREALA